MPRLHTYKDAVRRDFLVFAFAVDFGEIRDSDPTTWSVGYVRNPSVLFTTSSGATEERVPYFATQYEDIADAVCDITLHLLSIYSLHLLHCFSLRSTRSLAILKQHTAARWPSTKRSWMLPPRSLPHTRILSP